jgi:hypothetical protein
MARFRPLLSVQEVKIPSKRSIESSPISSSQIEKAPFTTKTKLMRKMRAWKRRKKKKSRRNR